MIPVSIHKNSEKKNCPLIIIIPAFLELQHLYFILAALFSQAADQIRKLYKMFVDVDATQIEVNPFGETDDGRGI